MTSCFDNVCVTSCPKDWELNGSHCYWANKTRVTWVEAEETCVQMGGHLPSITSKATNDFIWKGNLTRATRGTWIGGINIGSEQGMWKWTDCSEWEFTNWGGNQPSGFEDPENDQLCLTFNRFKGAWYNVQCEYEKYFVCSQKLCSGKKTILFHAILIFKETTSPTATTATTAKSELGMN